MAVIRMRAFVNVSIDTGDRHSGDSMDDASKRRVGVNPFDVKCRRLRQYLEYVRLQTSSASASWAISGVWEGDGSNL